jgi:hypothetical protein
MRHAGEAGDAESPLNARHPSSFTAAARRFPVAIERPLRSKIGRIKESRHP